MADTLSVMIGVEGIHLPQLTRAIPLLAGVTMGAEDIYTPLGYPVTAIIPVPTTSFALLVGREQTQLWDYNLNIVMLRLPDCSAVAPYWNVDGSLCFAGVTEQRLRFWGIDGKPAAADLPLPNPDGFAQALIAFTIDNQPRLAVGDDEDPEVHIVDPATGQLLSHRVTPDEDEGVLSLTSGVHDGKTLVVTGGWDRRICLWDPTTGQLVVRTYFGMVDEQLWGHTEAVEYLRWFTIEGQPRIASGSEDRTVAVWDALTGACLGRSPAFPGFLKGLAVGTDRTGDTRLITATDHTIHILDAQAQPVAELEVSTEIHSVTILPDNRMGIGYHDAVAVIDWTCMARA